MVNLENSAEDRYASHWSTFLKVYNWKFISTTSYPRTRWHSLGHTFCSQSVEWEEGVFVFLRPEGLLIVHREEEGVGSTLTQVCLIVSSLLSGLATSHLGGVDPGRDLEGRLLHQGGQDEREDHGQAHEEGGEDDLAHEPLLVPLGVVKPLDGERHDVFQHQLRPFNRGCYAQYSAHVLNTHPRPWSRGCWGCCPWSARCRLYPARAPPNLEIVHIETHYQTWIQVITAIRCMCKSNVFRLQKLKSVCGTDDIEVCDSTAIMYIIYENFKREEKYNYSTFGPIRNIFRKQNKGHKLSIVQCDINNKYLWHQDKRNNKECNLHAYCFSVLLNFTFLFPKTEYHHHQHLLRRHGSIDSGLDVRR